jgi:hypothetical protein
VPGATVTRGYDEYSCILTSEAERLATDPARKAALTRQADALLERWFQLQK